MGWREAAGLVSGIIYFLATVPYVLAALRGRVQPHFVAWAGGGVISGTTFLVQVTTDPTWSAAVAGASFSYCWIVAAIAFRQGSRVGTALDKACFLLGLVIVVAWRVSHSPGLAIGLAITADTVLCIPAIRKTYLDPNSEIPAPFLVSAFGAALAVAQRSVRPS